MKPYSALTVTLLIVVSTGCAIREQQLVLDPVGPAPSGSVSGRPEGTLVVFSAPEANAHFNGKPYHLYFSDYNIYSMTGALVREVHNDPGTILEGPVEVSLAPGQYKVRARASGWGIVLVPVVVQAGQVTALHLDGHSTTPAVVADSQMDLVRLPNGAIVGSRADLDRIRR